MLKNRHNNFLLTRTIFLSFWNADWEGAYNRHGAFGVAGEFFSSLFGTNTWPFFIDSEDDWDKFRISRLLGQYGIKLWGWGYSNGRFFFRVKKRQAQWAQYLLLENGVPVKGRLLKGYQNAGDTSMTEDKEDRNIPRNHEDSRDRRSSNPQRSGSPVDKVDKLIDILSGL